MKRFFKKTSAFRYLGLALIIIGIVVWIADQSPNNEIPLLAGLYILFISKVTREDERAISIKNSSTYIALIVGYGLKILLSNLYSHQLIPFELTEINHFLILVFALAITIYYCRLYISWGNPG